MTKLLTLGILFSTAVRAAVVAKLVILGILFLTSFILALRPVEVAKLVILDISPSTSFILALRVELVATLVIAGILSSIFLILVLYTFFLTASSSSLFTDHFVCLSQQEQVLIHQHPIYLLYFSNCLN